ncbi:hypothetical protein [Methanococcoides seepicolus]|uniref:Uncharacterized protein n=1 Tax=Methanococcoides seepicolus TaxID=2828780 RepID=A0A9E4ZG55_9EURY|nr:hypothetical protein [Methanococcoides seepicolus]MCM1986299.1 hypothetical protein [Methanococcoides seepicolus]
MRYIKGLGIILILVLTYFLFPHLYYYIADTTDSISPLCIIRNYDEYPHNATLKIIDSNDDLYMGELYQLDADQVIRIEKPKIVPLTSNPRRNKPSNEWDFYFESENISVNHSTVPHRVNTVVFEIYNESGDFGITCEETM